MSNSGLPWEKRKWRDGIIRPSKLGFIIVGIMGLVFTGMGGMPVLLSDSVVIWPLNEQSIILLFPIVGILLLFGAFVMGVRQWKYRGTMFRMETMPGVIGGKVHGVLVIPDLLGHDGVVDISLVNEKHRRSSGKNSSTYVTILFERKLSVNVADYSRSGLGFGRGEHIEIPVEFVVPFDTKDETDDHGRTNYMWLLKVKADVPGLDMDFQLPMPIFRTEKSSDEVTIEGMETEAAQEKLQEINCDSSQLREIEIVRQGGYEHYISRAKSLALLIIGFIFGGVGVGLIVQGVLGAIQGFGRGDGSWVVSLFEMVFTAVPVLMGLVFFAVGGGIFLAGIMTMGRRDVHVAGGVVKYNKKLGLLNFDKQIGRDYIIDVDVKKCGASNNKKYFAVRVHHTDSSQVSAIELFLRSKAPGKSDGKYSLEVARGVGDRAEALWLCEQLKEQLGLLEMAS